MDRHIPTHKKGAEWGTGGGEGCSGGKGKVKVLSPAIGSIIKKRYWGMRNGEALFLHASKRRP